MRTSPRGVRFIASREGFVGHPYRDAVGVWTIGYGHTGADTERMGRITEQQGQRLLAEDLRTFEQAVNRLVKVPLTQRQFNALVSFAYNLGAGALGESTLLRELNHRHYARAANEFLNWDMAGGRHLLGLTRRRRAERRMFLRGSKVRTRLRAARLRRFG